jgi:serine protease Do
MRYLILVTMLSMVLVTGLVASPNASGEAFGYSSEESGGSYLGVDTRDVTSDRLGALNLKEEKGVEVTMVDQDAPAGKAGLKEHDVILNLNGAEVESVEQLRRMIREIPPGRVASLGISRNGQPLTIKVQLADRKKAYGYSSHQNQYSYTMPAMPAIPAIPELPDMRDLDIPVSVVVVHSSRRSGLMIENLTSQLGDFFGAKNGEGVLVRSVEKGTPAEKAGFRAGDVIIKVNGERIVDASDFSHALQSRKDTTVSVNVIREKKEQTLTLTLPSRKQSELFQESFDLPEIDAETRRAIQEAQAEIARARPEMELAARELERARPEMERAARAMRQQQEQMRKDALKMREELRKEQRQLNERLRHELRGDWTRI